MNYRLYSLFFSSNYKVLAGHNHVGYLRGNFKYFNSRGICSNEIPALPYVIYCGILLFSLL